eukprot:GHVU01053579.1.p1 GENE.GHVU01053579.1~~GHVU01053579.1.p1  ORF type:complete len:256 (+),score=38.94 GHVU01053579.1:493-1260(+)
MSSWSSPRDDPERGADTDLAVRVRDLCASAFCVRVTTSTAVACMDGSVQAITRVTNDLNSLSDLAASGRGSAHTHRHQVNVAEAYKARLFDTTSQFKDILQQRTDNLRRLEDRQSKYGFAPPVDASSTNVDIESGMGSSFSSSSQQQQQHGGNQLSAMSTTSTYYRARTEGVEQAQRVLVELGTLFSRVAQMVAYQEEMVQRIDGDVDMSHEHLKSGQSELIKYYRYVKSNRSMILKLFAIIVFCVIFFCNFHVM